MSVNLLHLDYATFSGAASFHMRHHIESDQTQDRLYDMGWIRTAVDG